MIANILLAVSYLATSVLAANLPAYCYIDKINRYNPYAWDDESSVCKQAGVGDTCCVTWVQSGGGLCPQPSDRNNLNDLIIAFSNQVKKEGQLAVSSSGKWTCVFQLFTSAVSDRDVLVEWDHAVFNLAAAYPDQRVNAVYLTLNDNVIACNHIC